MMIPLFFGCMESFIPSKLPQVKEYVDLTPSHPFPSFNFVFQEWGTLINTIIHEFNKIAYCGFWAQHILQSQVSTNWQLYF